VIACIAFVFVDSAYFSQW